MSKLQSYSLEDAILQTKYGKFNYFLLIIAGLTLACGMLETNCINMILPIAQCELNLTNEHKGLLGSVGYIGIILSSHFWGFMADTRGRKKVIVPALLLSFLFTVISTFAKSFWFLALFRFLNGFCICAPQTIIYAFLGEFHSAAHRSRVLITASVTYGIFCLINPINGIFILNQEHWNFYIPLIDLNFRAWRIFLIMCALPSVICAIAMILFIPESPKYTYAQGDEQRTLEILQRIYTCNTGKSADEYKVKFLIKDQEFIDGSAGNMKSFFHFMWSQTVPLFKPPLLKNTLTACYLQFGICVVANGYWTFFPETMNKISIWSSENPSGKATVCSILDSFNANASAIANPEASACVTKLELSTFANVAVLTLLYSAFWFLISLAINKVGKFVILLIVAIACGSSSIIIMLIQIPQAAIYIYLVLLLAGLNMSIVNTSTVELFPTTLRAMAVSISMMTGRIGSVAGSNFVGASIKNFCTYTWLLPTVLMFSGALLSFTIPNINKRIK